MDDVAVGIADQAGWERGGERHVLYGTGLYQLHAYGLDGSEPAGWPKFVGGWLFTKLG